MIAVTSNSPAHVAEPVPTDRAQQSRTEHGQLSGYALHEIGGPRMTDSIIISALIAALASVSLYAFVARRRAWQAFDALQALAGTLGKLREDYASLHRTHQDLVRAVERYYEIEAERLNPMFRLADGVITAEKDMMAQTIVLTRDVRYPTVRYAISHEELYNLNPFGDGKLADGFCKYLADKMAREYAKVLLPEFASFAKKWIPYG